MLPIKQHNSSLITPARSKISSWEWLDDKIDLQQTLKSHEFSVERGSRPLLPSSSSSSSSSSPPPRSCLHDWLIRLSTSILLWTCLIQLIALVQLWHPNLLPACFDNANDFNNSVDRSEGSFPSSTSKSESDRTFSDHLASPRLPSKLSMHHNSSLFRFVSSIFSFHSFNDSSRFLCKFDIIVVFFSISSEFLCKSWYFIVIFHKSS